MATAGATRQNRHVQETCLFPAHPVGDEHLGRFSTPQAAVLAGDKCQQFVSEEPLKSPEFLNPQLQNPYRTVQQKPMWIPKDEETGRASEGRRLPESAL